MIQTIYTHSLNLTYHYFLLLFNFL